MAAALSLAGVGTASAHGHDHGGHGHKGGGGHCSAVQLKYSTDGGQHWTRGDTIGNAPKSIVVKLDGNVTKGCAYPISLAAYQTDGPDWAHSGTQVFLGVDQATLSSKNPKATLTVNGLKDSACFGQIDLYGNNTVYDGKSGKLPHYPDSATPTDLIAHWNGQYKPDCDHNGGGGDTPPPSGTPSTGPSDTSSPSTGPSDTSSPSTGPSDTTSPSPSTSASTGTPSTSPSSSAPAVGATAAPSGTPVAQPVSSTPTLAETGSNSSQTTTFIAAGAALVVIGAGAVVFTRRRKSGSNA
ncbi:LPXTG cell wall anchor domain-containing protein [Streptomyces sp. NRRL F-5126]|uniref:LPXTG cell wall anchor domain-containing protein n=1 Tax=Streptomyces sp. NRRL F-5126 TaxID=1463857 RepID=UPI000690CE8B|nr:LPXTG cell wall anchor domain-containing protein [Streptomyces sp. NRRL F-5126]